MHVNMYIECLCLNRSIQKGGETYHCNLFATFILTGLREGEGGGEGGVVDRTQTRNRKTFLNPPIVTWYFPSTSHIRHHLFKIDFENIL